MLSNYSLYYSSCRLFFIQAYYVLLLNVIHYIYFYHHFSFFIDTYLKTILKFLSYPTCLYNLCQYNYKKCLEFLFESLEDVVVHFKFSIYFIFPMTQEYVSDLFLKFYQNFLKFNSEISSNNIILNLLL